MGFAEYFAGLPRGKNDPPLVLGAGPLTYDFHDVDGLYYMLDRKLGGCLLMMWTKPMDETVRGKVTLDGFLVDGYVLQTMELMMGMHILGVPLRGLVTEYGKKYTLHIEGFKDMDGNIMAPADFTVTGIAKEDPDPAYAAHDRIALEAAREGIVLLKNDRKVLPLKPGKLNLFGKGVHEFRIGAVGAGKINPRYSVNFVEAVRNSSDYSLNEELVRFYGCDKDLIPDKEVMERARASSDTAIVFLTRAAGENQDASTAKGEYYLTEEEDILLKVVSEAFTHTVVILNVGYPISMAFLEKYKIDGLVYPGYAGMLAGPALLDVLSGEVNPSGKLTDTWAKDYYDIPSSRNFYDAADKPRLTAESREYADTVYEEDIYVGYRYFTTFHKQAAFPFGFGLSYTEFMMEPTQMTWDGRELGLKLFVKNMGKCAGKEVVQVYIGKPDSDLEKPEKELVFFEKTGLLQPGAVQEIDICVPKERLASYSEKLAAWVLDSGEYHVYAGNSAQAGLYKSFHVSERELISQVRNRMQPQEAFTRLSKFAADATFPKGEKSGVIKGKTCFEPYAVRQNYDADFSTAQAGEEISFDDVRSNPDMADAFVSKLTVEELARISICASAGWGMEGIGEAGSIFPVEGRGLPRFPVSDGNSGVNINVKNTGMPSGVTLCASFNRELIGDVARVIAEEAKENGIPMILAPAINIHRNPLNGRQPEYFSEDPYLAGEMAGYYCRGMEKTGVASCIKHMICNNCESTRKRNQSIVSERAIREIYFRAFQFAMQVHMPASAMTAYNAVNGVPTCADPDLMLGLMREENGFTGYFMTDWTSYDTADVAMMAAAGMSWITPGSMDDTYVKPIIDGISSGMIPETRLRRNAADMLRVVSRFS